MRVIQLYTNMHKVGVYVYKVPEAYHEFSRSTYISLSLSLLASCHADCVYDLWLRNKLTDLSLSLSLSFSLSCGSLSLGLGIHHSGRIVAIGTTDFRT